MWLYPADTNTNPEPSTNLQEYKNHQRREDEPQCLGLGRSQEGKVQYCTLCSALQSCALCSGVHLVQRCELYSVVHCAMLCIVQYCALLSVVHCALLSTEHCAVCLCAWDQSAKSLAKMSKHTAALAHCQLWPGQWGCALCSVQCIVQCVVCNVQCLVCSLQCSVCVCSVHC